MDKLSLFERITRLSGSYTDTSGLILGALHPFVSRDIHESIAIISRSLFDNGHYTHATVETFKFIDGLVQTSIGSKNTGWALMMEAFGSDEGKKMPKLKLSPCETQNEIDQQEGYKFIFGGSMRGIRNPRSHDIHWKDDPDSCLDCLSIASLLLRELEKNGIDINY